MIDWLVDWWWWMLHVPCGSPARDVTDTAFSVERIVFERTMNAVPLAFLNVTFSLGWFRFAMLRFGSVDNRRAINQSINRTAVPILITCMPINVKQGPYWVQYDSEAKKSNQTLATTHRKDMMAQKRCWIPPRTAAVHAASNNHFTDIRAKNLLLSWNGPILLRIFTAGGKNTIVNKNPEKQL